MQSRDHQRPHDVNQQIAKSVRPQLPRDGSKDMQRWEAGQLPKGGYRSTFEARLIPGSLARSCGGAVSKVPF